MSMTPEFVTFAKGFFAEQGVTAGLSTEHQCALVMQWLCESVLTDYSKESLNDAIAEAASATGEEKTQADAQVKYIKQTRADIFKTLYPLLNCSALRQRFEDQGVLTKVKGGRASVTAESLAGKYC